MSKMHFSIKINAPKTEVWDTMLNKGTYEEWTKGFSPNSNGYYEGNWDKGSQIRFLAPGENGKLSGMLCVVEDNKPQEYISLKVLGNVVDSKDDTTSAEAKAWYGAHENYTFTELPDGSTQLDVDLESSNEVKEVADQLNQMWPKALEKLKSLAEA